MSHKTHPEFDFSVENIHRKVDLIYRHNVLMSDYAVTARDYGIGEPMSEVEAHTLDYICDHEGITITQLSTDNYRTKGAVSQLITKLENKGLVERKKEEGNKKNVLVYPTQTGKQVSRVHREYDYKKTVQLISSMLEWCTAAEFEGFYKVLELRIKKFEEEYRYKK